MIVKTQQEREALVEGGKILAEILFKVGERCTVGTTLIELDSYTRELMEENSVKPSFLGIGSPPFPAVICISVNEGVVHGIPGSYDLKEGDILTLDTGIWHKDLCTDSAITIGVGNISDKDQKLIYAALETRDAQVSAAIVGNTVGDIGYASEQVLKKHGFNSPQELGGHGVGKEVHEPPFVSTYGAPGTGLVLEEGMVLALEPILVGGKGDVKLMDDQWLYETIDGSRSAQFEHTVIVGKNEPQVLTAHEE